MGFRVNRRASGFSIGERFFATLGAVLAYIADAVDPVEGIHVFVCTDHLWVVAS